MRRLGTLLLNASLLVGCGRSMTSDSGAAQTPVPVAKAATTVPRPSVENLESPPLAWAEAVRAELWEEAARSIRELPADAWRSPEIRFVFARIAHELSDQQTVIEQLEGLESELPLVASQISRLRAEAQLEAGPFDAAADYFGRSGDAESLLLLAMAQERAGSFEAARKSVDRALAKLGDKRNVRKLEVRARQLRARIAERQGKTKLAAADLRWLATRAPLAEGCEDVDERLERAAPGAKLTKDERLSRARAMADEGRVEAVEKELEAARKAPGAAPKPGKPLFLRAWALYNARRDYPRAAALFEQSIAAGSDDVARDLFYAARARSRAYDDEAAFAGYRNVAQRFPQTRYAELATYLAAKMRYTAGRWNEAAALYDEYLSRHPRGRYKTDATYERAIAWLAGGKAEPAREVFSRIAQRSSDRREAARARQLEGVALLESGKKDAAIAVFQQVIGEHPLTFHALVSAARLSALNAPVPPLISAAQRERRPELTFELPATVEFYRRLGLERDAEAELRAQEKALRRTYGERAGEVLCELYGRLGVAERRYALGQREAQRRELDLAPTESTRWMWECVYPRPYMNVVESVAREHLLTDELLHAIMRQESGFRPRVVSPAGAIGLMQLMPGTGERVARELNQEFALRLLESPSHNVRFGAYYLRKLLDMFGGNVALAAAGYNAGPQAVFHWLEGGKDLPLDLFVARIPFDETRGYVERIIGNLARYRYLEGGESEVMALSLELPRDLTRPSELY